MRRAVGYRLCRLGLTLVLLLSAGGAHAQTPARAPGAAPAAPTAPTEAELGAPLFPGAVYLGSYDAGRGQRFHLFGIASTFAEALTFYRGALKDKGDVVFETPPTYVFETGRFRQESMAFPPSVTVKDYTAGGSAGYPNPRRGGAPERFPVVLQIVPAPPAAPRK